MSQNILYILFFFKPKYVFFFSSETKKYVLVEENIREKDERSFPQKIETDQKRKYPSLENYMQR